MAKTKINLEAAMSKLEKIQQDSLKTKKPFGDRAAINKLLEKFVVTFSDGKKEMAYSAGSIRQKYIAHRSGNVIAQKPISLDDEPIHSRVLKHVKKRGNDIITLEELSDVFDVGISKVRDAISELRGQGHNVEITNNNVLFNSVIAKRDHVLDIQGMTANTFKFGVVGDNHMGSKYERMDVLNAMYDEFSRQGITTVFNTGNWIDGEARFNKTDINVFGMGNQLSYFVENYPKREGISTKFISGDDHEGWYNQREGVNIGDMAQLMAERNGRNDLIHLGYMESDVIIPAQHGETKIRVLHPGGGSSYAVSYAPQKIVESYQGGEKPDVLLVGHYHKASYNFIRGVHVVQTGCTQDQTPFMRKKKLAAHVGGWVFEFSVDKVGAITRFSTQFFPFYDNHYYEKWGYKW